MNAKLLKLRRLNLYMGALHAFQAVAVLALGKDVMFPVSTDYLRFNAATQSLAPDSGTLFMINITALVALFFLLSAFFHVFIATVYRKQYTADLKQGINRLRWIEYSLSASVMMVAIALLVGVYDAMSLLMIFCFTALMNLLGLAMELHNRTSKTVSWVTYNLGVFAGAVPWVVIAFYFWASSHFANAGPPTFVYWIFVSIFLFFNCFAINMILQYKKVGKWKDYLYGERAYVLLSLFAKSALAWQVFAGTLRP